MNFIGLLPLGDDMEYDPAGHVLMNRILVLPALMQESLREPIRTCRKKCGGDSFQVAVTVRGLHSTSMTCMQHYKKYCKASKLAWGT